MRMGWTGRAARLLAEGGVSKEEVRNAEVSAAIAAEKLKLERLGMTTAEIEEALKAPFQQHQGVPKRRSRYDSRPSWGQTTHDLSGRKKCNTCGEGGEYCTCGSAGTELEAEPEVSEAMPVKKKAKKTKAQAMDLSSKERTELARLLKKLVGE